MAFQKSLLVGLTVLVVAFLNIEQGFALQCYVCNSISEKNCTSNLDDSYKKNCTDIKTPWVTFNNQLPGAAAAKASTAFECVAVKEIKGATKNGTDVLRTCMPAGLSEKYLKESFSLYGVNISSAQICGKDLCNSSSNIYAGISSLLFSVMLLFLMK